MNYRIGDRVIHETYTGDGEYHKIYYIVKFSGADAILLSPTPDGTPSHVIYRGVLSSETYFKHLPERRTYFTDEDLFTI